ncbi:ABC transporter permease [Leucobacter allii]|uniref:Autoinducer 2 import system permease protein LsrC n=1 Tax=Leucobacter allii TaxID=2932247 RepID=A0ABY4FP27_9MICO|nr:ABC transporter permease [Leucobacter allii]UOQ58027.1 ABC transporter permease [Leucobacter allii]
MSELAAPAPSGTAAEPLIRRLLRRMPTSAWVFVAFIALFLLSGLLRPSLLTFGGLITTVTFAAILALASFGQTIAVIQGGIDLSVPNTIAFAALSFLTWNASLGPVLALLGALAASALIGFVNGFVIARIGLTPIVTTIAMNGLLLGVLLLSFSVSELTDVPAFLQAVTANKLPFLGTTIAAVVPLALVVLLALWALLNWTGWGRALFLVGSSEAAARLAGQPVARIRITGYMLSSTLAGLAGIAIVGYYNQAEPMMGAPYLLSSVAAVVVGGASIFGGRGSVLGTLAGALVLGQVSTLVVVFNLGTTVQDVVYGAIILVVVALYGRSGSR